MTDTTKDAAILASLAQRPQTRPNIAQSCGMSQSTAMHQLRRLSADRRIHICAWAKCNDGHTRAVYAAGPGRDAERPAKPARAAKPASASQAWSPAARAFGAMAQQLAGRAA